MPLTLVTGPANAEKAGVVLDRLRGALEREPILVVPTAPDRVRYQRELADEGLVFGVRVETFGRLLGEVASRAGASGRPVGPVTRRRLAVSAASRADLRVLAASAATPCRRPPLSSPTHAPLPGGLSGEDFEGLLAAFAG